MLLFQGDISDINHIMKDLSTMVHEQGEVLGKNQVTTNYSTLH